jgi:hypothetical protein
VPKPVTELTESEGNDDDSKGVRAVGTSLTPEFWRLFSVLLVAAMGVTFIATAALDALAVRLLRRRTPKPPAQALPRPAPEDRRVPVGH